MFLAMSNVGYTLVYCRRFIQNPPVDYDNNNDNEHLGGLFVDDVDACHVTPPPPVCTQSSVKPDIRQFRWFRCTIYEYIVQVAIGLHSLHNGLHKVTGPKVMFSTCYCVLHVIMFYKLLCSSRYCVLHVIVLYMLLCSTSYRVIQVIVFYTLLCLHVIVLYNLQ